MFAFVLQRLRRLGRRPQFALPAVSSLALGSAGVALLFSLVNAVLVAPLPYPDGERLTFVGWRFSESHTGAPGALSAGLARHVGDNARSFAATARYTEVGSAFALSIDDGLAQSVSGMRVDDGLLQTARAAPVAGRGFTAEESRNGAAVVVIHARLATRVYGDAAAAVGEDLVVDGVSREVVGVLPAWFSWHGPIDLVIPFGPGGEAFDHGHNTSLVGRLAPGVSIGQARAEVAALAAAYNDANGVIAWNDAWGPWLMPFKTLLVGSTSAPLSLLLAAVALLMLLACFNVANLLIADATASRGEAAVQLALGAQARHLRLRRLADCALLVAVGLGVGVMLAHAALPLVLRFGPAWLQQAAHPIEIDAVVVAALVPVGILATLVCALIASFGQRVVNVAQTLRGAAPGRGNARAPARKALVVAQIAASFVLLVGAGLLAASIARLTSVDLGFQTAGVHSAQISLADQRFRGEDAGRETAATVERLTDALGAQPGIAAVAAANSLPLVRGLNNWVPSADGDGGHSVEVRFVTPGYFDVLGIPLLTGRALAGSDRRDSEPVVVVNEAFSRTVLDGERLDGTVTMAGVGWRVVGVTADQRDISLRSATAPTMYVVYAQAPAALIAAANRWFPAALLARGAVAPDFRRVLENVAPEVPLVSARDLRTVVAESLPVERFVGLLLIAFGACALSLSVTGLFGLLEFERVQRRHELAVRVALGARAHQIMALVLRQGIVWAVAGIAVGGALALPALSVLENLLYQPGGADVAVVAGLAIGVLLVTIAVTAISARRAARVAPNMALRHE